jgi:hypothetical protein
LADESGRGLTGLWSRLGPRRSSETTSVAAEAGSLVPADVPTSPTKALRKFLATLSACDAPVLLDLGPVIGSNLNFFGETLGCKVFIEDVFADLDRHLRANTLDKLPAFLEGRFPHSDASFDGILAWDLIDYLDLPAAQVLARQLTRLLRVDGAVLGFFNANQPRGELNYTKYIVVDEATLRHREYPAARGRQRVLQNRDINRLFDRLRVSDSFLLQTNMREMLFRKPAYLAGASSAP